MSTQKFDPRTDYNFLTASVKKFANKSIIPSSILIYGEKAFPIAVDKNNNTYIAGSIVEKGRLVHVGHNSYISQNNIDKQFLRNTIAWLSQESNDIVIGIEKGLNQIKSYLESEGYNVITAEVDELSKINIFITTTSKDLSDEEDTAVQKYLRNGGGLLTAGQAWWWSSQNQHLSVGEDYPGNQMLKDSGLMISGKNLTADPLDIHLKPDLEKININTALTMIEEKIDGIIELSKEDIDELVEKINNAIDIFPLGMEAIFARVKEVRAKIGKLEATAKTPIDVIKNPLMKMAARIDYSYANSLPTDKIEVHESSHHFPGKVEENAQRVIAKIEINASYKGRSKEFFASQPSKDVWRSTGIYAPPGEDVKITIPNGTTEKGLKVQIGSHSDKLWKLEKWKRFPDITSKWQLESTETIVASSFGGLVYILVPIGMELGKIKIEIDGGVKAPRYILNETTNEEWINDIRHNPAPWAEFESDDIIFTLPSSDAKKIENPIDLMNKWQQVMDKSADLAAINQQRTRPERVVFDEQISGGALHSGYPIMGHLHHVEEATDLEALSSKGSWGIFHELGHNHQWKDLDLPGTIEATCNLWSVFINEELLEIDRSEAHSALENAKRVERIDSYINNGRNFKQDWNVWTALETYLQLQQNFGWSAFKELNSMYYKLNENNKPSTEQEKIDLFVELFSQITEKNLSPFFADWGLNISPNTLLLTSKYEDAELDIRNTTARKPEPPEIARINDEEDLVLSENEYNIKSNEQRPEISIYAESASFIDILVDEIININGEDTLLRTNHGGRATPQGNNRYSFRPTTDLIDGKRYKIRAKLTDKAGNISSFSQSHNLKIEQLNSNVDGIAPILSSAATNASGTKIILTYNEKLSKKGAAKTDFAITSNGKDNWRLNAAEVDISGSTVKLTMEKIIKSGNTVSIMYTDPSVEDDNNAIQDPSGNDAESFSPTEVTNNSSIDGTAPIFISASTNAAGRKVFLTYDEKLSAKTASNSDFSIITDNADNEVISVGISASTIGKINLTLANPVKIGQAVNVAYTDPSSADDTYAIQDREGNDAVSFKRTEVTNNSSIDGRAPLFKSAFTNSTGRIILLNYDEILSVKTAEKNDFIVKSNGISNNVTAVTINNATVKLNLDTPVNKEQTVTVAYADPSLKDDANAIQDRKGNDAASLGRLAITNNSTLNNPTITPNARFIYFSQNQIKQMPVAAIKQVLKSELSDLSPKAVKGFTQKQLSALNRHVFSGLDETQLSKLTTDAITGLKKAHLKTLNEEEISAFKAKALKKIPPDAISGLKPDSLNALSRRQIRAFTDDQLLGMNKSQIRRADSFIDNLSRKQRNILPSASTRQARLIIDPANMIDDIYALTTAVEPLF